MDVKAIDAPAPLPMEDLLPRVLVAACSSARSLNPIDWHPIGECLDRLDWRQVEEWGPDTGFELLLDLLEAHFRAPMAEHWTTAVVEVVGACVEWLGRSSEGQKEWARRGRAHVALKYLQAAIRTPPPGLCQHTMSGAWLSLGMCYKYKLLQPRRAGVSGEEREAGEKEEGEGLTVRDFFGALQRELGDRHTPGQAIRIDEAPAAHGMVWAAAKLVPLLTSAERVELLDVINGVPHYHRCRCMVGVRVQVRTKLAEAMRTSPPFPAASSSV